MLSLQRCREILGQESGLVDDQQLERLRDQIYGLVDVITDQIKDSMANPTPADRESSGIRPKGFDAALQSLAPEEREEVEERAAIIEFEGHLNRDTAERRAVLIAVGKRH